MEGELSGSPLPDDVARLILEHIDSVPHLETLVLLWENEALPWNEGDVAARIYQPPELTRTILKDLQRKRLVTEVEGHYAPSREPERRDVIRQIVAAYHRSVYRVATLIHYRASQPVREFARAFDLRGKDKK
jgi:hypothetical protein